MEAEKKMGKRRRMKDRYRRISFLSDIEGMKNAIGKMLGKFFLKQSLQSKPHSCINFIPTYAFGPVI